MEFELKNKNGAIPCLVVADYDNGRFMIREEDTSGEIFNDPTTMLSWIEKNWNSKDFEDEMLYSKMVASLEQIAHEEST
ncbi:hypothetical protein FS935_03095 [Metabacillus litoralis]|uniref:Threonine dehydratase n=1 Tax=Metabacillus litoralis TaxID=152268 RepID=A0A5C6W712_9BACI|nr:hypothetical protein [Metabacillus litoralis]TXC93194.1 hypothetical protein FS935_03095 [Metabacillus litoralis]